MITAIDEKITVIIEDQTKNQKLINGVVFDDSKFPLRVEKIMHSERLENPEKDVRKKMEDNEKTENKASIKQKNREGKAKNSKTFAKRTKDKEVTVCV